jgi:hypothetical protein
MHMTVDEPASASFPDTGDPGSYSEILLGSLRKPASPASADEHDVRGANLDPLLPHGRIEVIRRDQVGRFTHFAAEGRRHIQEYSASHHGRDHVNAVPGEPAAVVDDGGLSAEEQALVRYMTQGIDMRSDMSAHNQQIISGGTAVRPYDFAMQTREGVTELRMIRRLRHSDKEWPAKVEYPDA